MLDFLPSKLKNSIFSSFKSVYEVRLRADKPIKVKGSTGEGVAYKELKYDISKNDLEEIVLKLCNHSLFCVDNSLKAGFITSKNGERVGLCGDVVSNNEIVTTIKNFSSIIIRLPNCVLGCSYEFANQLQGAKNCLIISPPFQGKTTFIRDLGRYYSNVFGANVLYIDERDELSGGGCFDLGKNADVLRFSNKAFGFLNGVRAYNPDVIVCDELMSLSDCKSVEFAKNSGVKVIASVHSNNIENLFKKQNISAIIKSNTFDYIVLLEQFKVIKIYEEQDWLKYL